MFPMRAGFLTRLRAEGDCAAGSDREVFEPLTRLTDAIWPGTPVTAVMENGASDSIYFAQAGIPCYGYSAMAMERGDDRPHGRDERVPVDSYFKSLDFFYAFSKALGGN